MAIQKTPEIQCSDDVIAKVFASMYFALMKRGTKAPDGSTSIDWTFFKSYCRRIFEEPPIRIENAMNILVKMKLAKYEIGKPPENPKGPDVTLKVHVTDISILDNFFEFFQYYYYNPGKKGVLAFDDLSTNIAESLVEEAGKLQADRFGMTLVPFIVVSENYTNRTGSQIVPTHIQTLDSKGIFCKMRNIEGKGVLIEFDAKDVKNLLFSWKFLREIKRWNEKGSVDPNEAEQKTVKKVMASAGSCATCGAPKVAEARFCHSCGAKIAS